MAENNNNVLLTTCYKKLFTKKQWRIYILKIHKQLCMAALDHTFQSNNVSKKQPEMSLFLSKSVVCILHLLIKWTRSHIFSWEYSEILRSFYFQNRIKQLHLEYGELFEIMAWCTFFKTKNLAKKFSRKIRIF